MPNCPTCGDTGKIQMSFAEVNTPGVDPTPRNVTISCYRCTDHNGNFLPAPKVFQEDLATFCTCEKGPNNGRYVPDGECPDWECPITHHHYHCTRCGKVGQIG